jgi:2-alkenal reductase
LIGVNTAIFSRSGTNAGIGFAIPVDGVNRIAPELIRNGKVRTPGKRRTRTSAPGRPRSAPAF